MRLDFSYSGGSATFHVDTRDAVIINGIVVGYNHSRAWCAAWKEALNG
jgi:hypothetical protein